MEYYYIPNSPLAEDDEVSSEEGLSRGARAIAGAIGGAGTYIPSEMTKDVVWSKLSKDLADDFNEIRNNPELKEKEMKNLIKTYQNFVEQTGNKIEHFVNQPGTNRWAAGTTKDGQDVIYWDSTAPHAAVMAHELGHIHMNHANGVTDPLAGLQTSGLGRLSAALAPLLGVAGGTIGYNRGGVRGGLLGTAAGAIGGSGQFAYELGGATGRAIDYLPEEVDRDDAYGDLFRAGMTYGMAGPGTAIAAGLGGIGAAAAVNNPRVRRFAGQIMKQLNAPEIT